MNRTALTGVVLLTAVLIGGVVCFADAYDAQDTGDGSQGIPYICHVADADGKLTTTEESVVDYITVDGADTSWGVDSTESWYVVDGDVSIGGSVTVNGDVNLILTDGSSLTADYITVNQDDSITVYGQSEGSGRMVLEKGTSVAALGGGSDNGSGTIAIQGGDIRAVSSWYGAGIGGGSNGNGTVIIYGGTVYAESETGAGIGGGYGGAGDVTIYGGVITSKTSGTPNNGAAIGNGHGSAAGDGSVTIYGGKIIAEAYSAAAIGGGFLNEGACDVIILGGEVTATSTSGAAIGGGNFGAAGTVTISGGTVHAISGSGAAIGSGSDAECGTVVITGGIVNADSNHAAGIGAGSGAGGGVITISGGVVTATTNGSGSDIGATGGTEGSFSTGADGNAVIFADRIGALDVDSPDLKAIIFQSGTGRMYGESVTPTAGFDIGGDTLTIGDGQSLIIVEGVTVTGTGGRITSDGTASVVFDGGSVDDGILADDVKRVIHTSMEVDIERWAYLVGDEAIIKVVVTDAMGDPIPSGSVTLEADSYSEDAPLVGGSCSFTYSCQEQGVINLYLSYSENTTGNTTYSMCETELEIEVNVDNEGEPGGTSDGGDDNTGLYAAVIVIVIVVIVVAIFVIRRDR